MHNLNPVCLCAFAPLREVLRPCARREASDETRACLNLSHSVSVLSQCVSLMSQSVSLLSHFCLNLSHLRSPQPAFSSRKAASRPFQTQFFAFKRTRVSPKS